MAATLPNVQSISSYGGPFQDALPQQDPTTEVASSSFNQLINDASAATATQPRAIFQFTGSATTPALASTSTWSSGFSSVFGSASAVLPVFVRNSIGNITITFPATVPDQLGNTNTLNLRAGRANLTSGSTASPSFIVSVVSSNQINVLMQAAGSLSDFAGSTIFVECF